MKRPASRRFSGQMWASRGEARLWDFAAVRRARSHAGLSGAAGWALPEGRVERIQALRESSRDVITSAALTLAQSRERIRSTRLLLAVGRSAVGEAVSPSTPRGSTLLGGVSAAGSRDGRTLS